MIEPFNRVVFEEFVVLNTLTEFYQILENILPLLMDATSSNASLNNRSNHQDATSSNASLNNRSNHQDAIPLNIIEDNCLPESDWKLLLKDKCGRCYTEKKEVKKFLARNNMDFGEDTNGEIDGEIGGEIGGEIDDDDILYDFVLNNFVPMPISVPNKERAIADVLD
ncbi:hypothetical protein C1645_826904 [Glomus cerebriforme]|uniref:Uncharacterized protein n=1 Tax=Glomus cerebriforme TaxID=658196 RepID=A0A397SYT6_9GLOM|nr:hypothetical protein C1645_826904 [Glomus cerebriforme]